MVSSDGRMREDRWIYRERRVREECSSEQSSWKLVDTISRPTLPNDTDIGWTRAAANVMAAPLALLCISPSVLRSSASLTLPMHISEMMPVFLE